MVDTESTKQAFAGLIDKPALTDSLLNRPPFKFILDIVTNTISATGYLKSQFPKSDLDPAALAEKAAKTAFLDKLIAAVDDGSLSNVKSAKIVAGKEPELTNKLLVKFAENARSQKSSGKDTKEKKHSSSSKERSSSKDKVKSKDPKEKEKRSSSASRDKEKSSRSSSKEPKKDKKDDKKESKTKSKDKEEKGEKKKSKKHSDEKTSKEKKVSKHSKHKEEQGPSTSANVVPAVDMNSNLVDKEMDKGFEEVLRTESPSLAEKLSPGNDSGVGELPDALRSELPTSPPAPLPPPPAEREFQRPSTAAVRPQTSMGRPGTAAARPAPPKLKKKHIAATEETPTIPEANVQIIEGENDDSKEDKNDFVVEEAIQEEFVPDLSQPTKIEAEEGGLVAKMMETKAGLEEGQFLDDIDEDDSEFTREMHKVQELQKTLQNVTRTTYPLAHVFEYAQEDLESMMRELEKWRAETRTNEVELKDRETSGIGEAHKLSNMLTSLEEEIRSVKSNLSNVKARINANEERIHLLIKDI